MRAASAPDGRPASEFVVQILLYQLLWFGLWGVVLLVLRGQKKPCADTKNRLVSVVHGLVSLGLSIIDLLLLRPELAEPNSVFESNSIIFSVSYFIYDSIGCYLIDLCDSDLVIHHSVSIVGLGWSLFTRNGGPYLYLGLFFAEVSNFPMHVRKILNNTGLRNTELYELSETLYFGLYTLARGIGGPYVLYVGLCNFRQTPFPLMAVTAMLVSQSLGFISTMIKIVKKKLQNRDERMRKNVNLFWLSVNPRVHSLDYTKRSASPDKVF